MINDNTPEARAERIRQCQLALLELGVTPVGQYIGKDIGYIDPSPRPFIVQVPLVEYFERMTRWKADPWQIDMGNRLQKAAEHRHIRGVRQVLHAEPQIGKTIWISQHLPAWLFGHDPLFRFALAMYNTAQSEKHSKVVIRILSSATHKDIFPNKDGWLYGDFGDRERGDRPVQTAVSGWYTNAGRGNDDTPGNAGQFSFNPVGLVSGLTGSGFDWLIGDDPYRSEKDAFSPTVNQSIRDFLDFLESRINLHSNLSLMFHRYAYDDAAAYCLDKGDFDYIRYASECDGPYLHESTGEQFADPLNREIGELISPRRGLDYYAKVKKNPRVWSAMNQGRPVAAGSEFFLVDKIRIRPAIEAIARRAECTVMVRAWDLAATEEAGDYSTAPLVGMSPDGRTTIFEMARRQVESAGRDALMLETAKRDGHDVVVSIPQDPGAAGKTVVFYVEQLLKGYQVAVRPTTGSKEDRARSYAAAVNSGDVDFVDDSELAEDAKWIDETKKEMRQFLLSALTHDDTIDAGADGYNECFERISTGLVIKNLKLARNLVTWWQFGQQFTPKGADKPIDQIPAHWTLYVGAKITPEATKANSAVIVARAPQNTNIVDTLFIVAEYKEFTSDFYALFDWIDIALESYCENSENAIIWLHPDSEEYRPTIHQKLNRPVALFEATDPAAGITELNFYLKPRPGVINPFTEREQGCGLYALIGDTRQFAAATDEYGLYSFRQEASTWGFTDKGEPSQAGAVLDCLRMVTYCFRTSAAPKTLEEKVEDRIGKKLTVAAIEAMPDSDVRDNTIAKRIMEEAKVRAALTRPVRSAASSRFGRK